MEVIVQRGTHLVCSMFPYMEVIVQRGYTSCLFNVSLIWKLLYKGGTHLVCSMFPYMEVIVQRGYTSCLFNVSLYGSYCTKGVHILFVQCFLIWKLLYKGGTHLVSLNMEVIVQRGTHLVCSMFPYMEVIVQRGYTSCLFNVSLYGSYCTKGVHILFVQCFLIWKLLYKGGTHLVCSMFPYMESYCYKGGTHLVCSMFPNMEVIVQRGTHLVCSMFP